mgnify:CR=1 FL=1
MSKRVKRTSLEVLYSILRACSENSSKTRVMYSAGVNLVELTKYLEALEKGGYIQSIQQGRTTIYSLTDKGKDAMLRLEKYVKALKEYEEAKKDILDLMNLLKSKKKQG